MAQTKRKRRTKHRGNAAGMVEARGRTGRKPTASEASRGKGSGPRPNRFDQPPTWRSAANRALVAAVLFGAAVILLFGRPAAAGIALAATMLLVYIPMTYYTDRFMYRRRQRQRAEGKIT